MKQLLTVIALICIFMNLAWAGSAEADKALLAPERIAIFAKSVEQYAAEQGAHAFIIGRVGRPEKDLPAGVKFTHTAIAIYSAITLADGSVVNGYAIHNLYQLPNELNKSHLVTDYPVDFFWGVHSLKAGIVIPTREMQQKLIAAIATGKDKMVHNANYSVIANPFNSQFQNCTEYTLDVINAAIYDTTDISRLKANAKAHFNPQRIKTSRFKLALGSLFMDDVTTKDHDGRVKTATFTTIANYLTENNLIEQRVMLDEQGVVTSI